MSKLHPVVMLLACVFIIHPIIAQDSASRADQLLSFPTRLIERVNNKATRIENNILAKTDKSLRQLWKAERRLKKKLYRKDTATANKLFYNSEEQYKSLQNKFSDKANKTKGREYIPFLDTLTTSLHFLQINRPDINSKSVQQSLARISEMNGKFQQAKDVQEQLRARRAYLTQQLTQLNMVKALKQYNKKLYYYQAQIDEYRNILKQPDKIERKAIDLLSKAKTFQEFMAKNSLLASIFPRPGGGNNLISQAGLPGLQTSAQVNSLVQQAAGSGPGNLQAIQSNMQQAQTQIQQLKNKVNALGEKEGDAVMPNFRPNSQRVKSFWQRWELGTNLQSTRSNNWMPTATQIGLSAGYKLNDRSVVGIGMAGSIGWGKSISNIIVSYEGIGARSFLDYKLKGSFWLSGGYEMNYRTTFTRLEQLNSLNAWQQSGLIGISKKYKVGKKMKGSMNLLWDYLSYAQIPRTQPVVFRFGYSLK